MLTVTLKGADTLARGLAAAPAAARSATAAAMQRSVLLIEADARRGVPQDTRALMNSVHSLVKSTPAVTTGTVGAALRYGLFVERGTRPHWPPAGPLEGWARRHGIPVFLVQRAIARKGTKARPFLVPAFEKNLHAVTALFQQIGGQVVRAIVSGSGSR